MKENPVYNKGLLRSETKVQIFAEQTPHINDLFIDVLEAIIPGCPGRRLSLQVGDQSRKSGIEEVVTAVWTSLFPWQ
jgi:hypothetical protein